MMHCIAMEWEVAGASPPSWTQADYHLLSMYRWTIKVQSGADNQINQICSTSSSNEILKQLFAFSQKQNFQSSTLCCRSKHFLPQHINCLMYFLSTSSSFISQGNSFKIRLAFDQKPFSCRSSGGLSDWKYDITSEGSGVKQEHIWIGNKAI